MVPSPRRGPAVAAALLAAGGLAGCGAGGDTGCGPITRESLDPSYLVHVLSDDDAVEYTSDPPTSGPHRAGPPQEGVVRDPLPRPIQVGILERGDVLLQHRPDLDDASRAQLEALAGPGVVVAPNPDLPEPVVATAWLYKRTCGSVDVGALRELIDARLGRGPES